MLIDIRSCGDPKILTLDAENGKNPVGQMVYSNWINKGTVPTSDKIRNLPSRKKVQEETPSPSPADLLPVLSSKANFVTMAKSQSVVKAADAPESLADSKQVLKATKALLSFVKKSVASKPAPEKKDLLADDDEPEPLSVWLTLTTKKHLSDSNRMKPCSWAAFLAFDSDPLLR